jgi:hypothetical protein
MTFKHALVAAGLLVAGVFGSTTESRAVTLAAVPDNLIVNHSGLEWVCASPCSGGCSTIDFSFQGPLGWRFATEAEFLLHPVLDSFVDALQPSGYKCAAEYFDSDYIHCDPSDFENGALTSLPNDDSWDTLLVRDQLGATAIPVPAALPLLLSGLLGLGALGVRRRKSA